VAWLRVLTLRSFGGVRPPQDDNVLCAANHQSVWRLDENVCV
jgi:hypothetical protein